MRVTSIQLPAVACLLVGSTLAAAAAGRPCRSDTDCSLNGRCATTGGSGAPACQCDKPWSGPRCATMRFKPVAFPQGYGQAPSLTAWGGGAIFDGKQYHAYIHTIANGCPLACGSNSRIEHGVSENATGPYSFLDVAVPTDARNSAPITLPDGSYAIFHIQEGNTDPEEVVHCAQPWRWPADPRSRFDCPLAAAVADGGGGGPDAGGGAGSTIHTSKSLAGPWTPLAPNTLPRCGNPAPHVHRNGSLFVVCQHNMLLRAEDIRGPWVLVTDLTSVLDGASGGVPGKYEDPFLYIDTRENWHVVYHVYNTVDGAQGGLGACRNTTVSGHIYSTDGHTWHASPTSPYTSQVALVGGRSVTVSTRERPNILFDQSGQMTHLFNAVCAADGDACAAHTGTGCVDCKYKQPDYNLVAPLDV